MAYSRKMTKSRKSRKTRKTTKAGSRKHKSWNMKGCSWNKKGGCSSCITGMHGGNGFGAAFYNGKGGYKGGNFYKPAAPIPGPFVGQPWTPAINGWPGVDGIGANRNYIADNLYPTDISRQMKLEGGKRRHSKTKKHRKSKKSYKRGGAILPQDLTNLGRELSFSMGSAYNAVNGYPAPVNPAPYVQPNLAKTSLMI
jgi:hypothetical protein